MIEAIPGNEDPYLQSINQNLCGPEIPANFDPLKLEPDERAEVLKYLILPAEPIKENEPDLYTFWTQLFSPSTTYVTARLAYSRAPAQPSKPRPPRRIAPLSRQQSSGSWSGASLIARDGRMFTDVMATWTVPEVMVPASALATDQNAAAKAYKSSCWVGLDGQRSYADSTLPQVGTEQSFNKNSPDEGQAATVWFEWWPMDEMTIEPLSVKYGDRVYCWLTALSYTRARCVVKVVSDRDEQLVRFCADAPVVKYSPPPIPEYYPNIAGATAQWITEAPTDSVTQAPLPLPNYRHVTFLHCYALSAPAPGTDDYRVEPLIKPTLSRMYSIADNPPRRVTISTATRPEAQPGLNAVRTTFVG